MVIQSHSSEAGWHDRAARMKDQVATLYERCQAAYHTFDGLPQLIDQMRIMSVNAELVSARAGDHGRAVRVLTQFVTEAVTRMLAMIPEMVALKKCTYAQAGMVLRIANDVDKIEGGGARILATGRTPGDSALAALEAAWRNEMKGFGEAVAGMRRAHEGLVGMVRTAREVVLQVELISANIAIEASGAGPFEADIKAIADFMRGRVEELRAMVDNAGRSLRAVADMNHALAALAVGRI
ncbi:hypothetical protein [Magnetospirillum sp. UT-4]|uniref:hypothetical protein n=1 Tax=Magnetospirillum sp. UT-4 TaxID=2681467 RepID=UPI00137C6A78|nr:hypothetical protein [Magnetospirillum sp. UT-4]CAA7615207.1 putative Methyl-accepting chemotaxis protein [Magnetospirillum sp. UT-4]